MVTTEELNLVEMGLDSEFEKLLDGYLLQNKSEAGQITKGSVVQLEKDGALVDIGYKSEAFLPFREVVNKEDDRKLEEVIEPGKEYEFYILKEETETTPLVISYKRVALARGWVKLEELKKTNETIEGEVVTLVKGGLVVEAYGVRGFIPASQLRVKSDTHNKGSKIPFKILEMDNRKNKLICSQKAAVEDEKAGLREKAMNELEIGQVIDGEVVRVAEFGAFIDIGGIDGLLPVSEISWQRINHPNEVLEVGQQIQVKVLKKDIQSGRISLSLKRLSPDPWTEIESQFAEGQVVKGKVSKIAVFGAFVEIYPGVEALLPVSEIVEEDEEATPDKYLKKGDELEVLIKKFSPYERRISLALKEIIGGGVEEPKEAA